MKRSLGFRNMANEDQLFTFNYLLISCLSSMIVQVRVVFRKTVVGD